MKKDDRNAREDKTPAGLITRQPASRSTQIGRARCTVFGFWEATANKVGVVEVTAFVGSTSHCHLVCYTHLPLYHR
jgi:hypothetical protein